ncbi:MAG: hypothetical protein H0T54_07250 [Geodermatophilaceae bacterium]|nr:hypothetical protein [Geodermatophilaceae bacterium]
MPSTHRPSFHVDRSVRLVPVNGLVGVNDPFSRHVLLGGGKTGMDACIWLLDNGVEPDPIRWIRPRESWLLNREGFQPLEQVTSSVEGLSHDVEAAAGAESAEDLFHRLEACGRMIRIDDQVVPTMYRCATVNYAEVAQLRRVV